jgi:hypothetical protein
MQADAAEEVDRAVLPEEVPAADVEEGPRRELESLGGRAALFRAAHDAQPPFDAAPIPTVVAGASSIVTADRAAFRRRAPAP